MVRKKQEVIEWFRDLDSASRIDVVCSFLHLCSPWELRFFGTCLEDLARRDYHQLREYEIKANDMTELQELSDAVRNAHGAHSKIRQRLIICLCLMHSIPNNVMCTTIVHQLLCAMEEHIELLSFDSPIDETFVADIRLLLSIAIHHPAFSFRQRQDFKNILESFRKVFGEAHYEDYTDDTIENQHKEVITGLSLIQTDKTKSEALFHIEVTTSRFRQFIVKKTLKDIRSFHQALLVHFPNDARAPKKDRKIPLLKEDSTGSYCLEDYIKGLSKMSSDLLDCQTIHQFFLLAEDETCNSTKLASPITENEVRSVEKYSPPSTTTASALHSLPQHAVTVNNSSSSTKQAPAKYQRQRTISGSKQNSIIQSALSTSSITSNSSTSPQSQVVRSLNSPNYPQSTDRHLSSVSSRYTSSRDAVNQQCLPLNTRQTQSTARKQDTPLFKHYSTYQLLKTLRLHKYDKHFKDVNIEELLEMSKQDLKDRGLVDGAARKLHEEIEKEKQKRLLLHQHQRDNENEYRRSALHQHITDNITNHTAFSDTASSEFSSPSTSPSLQSTHPSLATYTGQNVHQRSNSALHSHSEDKVRRMMSVPMQRSRSSSHIDVSAVPLTRAAITSTLSASSDLIDRSQPSTHPTAVYNNTKSARRPPPQPTWTTHEARPPTLPLYNLTHAASLPPSHAVFPPSHTIIPPHTLPLDIQLVNDSSSCVEPPMSYPPSVQRPPPLPAQPTETTKSTTATRTSSESSIKSSRWQQQQQFTHTDNSQIDQDQGTVSEPIIQFTNDISSTTHPSVKSTQPLTPPHRTHSLPPKSLTNRQKPKVKTVAEIQQQQKEKKSAAWNNSASVSLANKTTASNAAGSVETFIDTAAPIAGASVPSPYSPLSAGEQLTILLYNHDVYDSQQQYVTLSSVTTAGQVPQSSVPAVMKSSVRQSENGYNEVFASDAEYSTDLPINLDHRLQQVDSMIDMHNKSVMTTSQQMLLHPHTMYINHPGDVTDPHFISALSSMKPPPQQPYNYYHIAADPNKYLVTEAYAPCTCPHCVTAMPPYYMPAAPLPAHHPMMHGNIPTQPPHQHTHQNGIVYHPGFAHPTMTPTSNGLVSPGFSRGAGSTGNKGISHPPDMLLQPINHHMPPVRPATAVYNGPHQSHTTYAPPSTHAYSYTIGGVGGSKLNCTNCGSNSHTRLGCVEPPDTSNSINHYRLDILPPTDQSAEHSIHITNQ